MNLASSEYRTVPLEQLHESKTNPRRHLDAKGLDELTESIKAKGVLVPLLVRAHNGGFEIVAGSRRYQAAKRAALTELPCLIRTLTDLEVLEAQVIENLQREDVHPLDEAEGYLALVKKGHYDAARIAERVGRSVKYVYDRMKLLALTKEARDLFWSGKISAGHAILLARLSAADQNRCIEEDGGLFRAEQTLYDEEKDQAKDKYAGMVTVGVRELEDWIKRHVRFDHKQPDPMLFPETAQALDEAADEKRKVVEITDEYLASDDVRSAATARVYGERAWRRADGREGSKPCAYAVLGVFAAGGHRGEAFNVCLRKDKCLVHWGQEIKAREKAAKGDAPRDRYHEQEQKRQEKYRQENEQREALRARWTKATPAILEAVAERVKKMPADGSSLLAQLVIQDSESYEIRSKKAVEYVPRGKKAEDVIRHAAFLIVAKKARGYAAPETFPKVAKALGLDLPKILNQAVPVPKPAVQTSAQVTKKKGESE